MANQAVPTTFVLISEQDRGREGKIAGCGWHIGC
jgi:hypothetical protein